MTPWEPQQPESGASSAAVRPFYGEPFWWLVFGVALVAVPVAGYLVDAGIPWEQVHPAINAMLNACSAVFLTAGWFAIRRRRVAFHRRCMLAAFGTSAVFLVSYLARYAMTGTHYYPGHDWDRIVYLAILISHMILAMAVLPLVLRSLHLGLKGRYGRHRRLARWAWPIWMYVSVTGVVVYLMLYQLAPALHG